MGLKKKERKKEKERRRRRKKKKKRWSASEEEGKKEKERRRRRRKKKLECGSEEEREKEKESRRRRKKEERGIAVGDEWFDLTTHKSWPPQSPYIYQCATELCNSETENTNLVFPVVCTVAQLKLSLSDENNEKKSSQTQYFQWVPRNSQFE